MSVQFQASLVEAAQTTTPALTGLAGTRRTPLSAGAWIDIRPNWVSGADDVFAALVDDVPWRAEQRQMWDKVVDVPRLVHTYMPGDPLPHALLDAARDALSSHYGDELGEQFGSARCSYDRKRGG